MLDLILQFADYMGLIVFALSGAVVAVRKNMDIFGIIFLAFLPAIGGGTLRDLLLDLPVFWLTDGYAIILIILSAIFVFFFYNHVRNFKPLRWADAAGMSLFTVTGAAKAYALDFGFLIVVIMGTLTACAGGLIRDVITNEEPLLLKTDIYATAAILGASVYYAGMYTGFSQTFSVFAGILAAFVLRSLAIIFKLSLPQAIGKSSRSDPSQ